MSAPYARLLSLTISVCSPFIFSFTLPASTRCRSSSTISDAALVSTTRSRPVAMSTPQVCIFHSPKSFSLNGGSVGMRGCAGEGAADDIA